MYNDTIADMLNRIRNATLVKHDRVAVPHSKVKESIAKIFKSEGLIQDYKIATSGIKKDIIIDLKYYSKKRENVIRGLKRISKPGRRVYVDADSVPRVLRGLGIAILSTSKGIVTDAVCRKNRSGGEVLCYVW